jgi:electron transport complex protein RnfD
MAENENFAAEQAKVPAAQPAKPAGAPPVLFLASSPHIGSPVTARPLMTNVLIALAPAAVFGVVIYGVPALLTIVISVATAIIGESLFRLITRQDVRVRDLSAVVSGLLLALVLPPSTPLWMTALGAAFAIIMAKEFFGGLGANVFNPALIGRAFLIMSFPAALTNWTLPGGFGADAVSSPTPLGIVKLGGSIAAVGEALAGSPDYRQVIKTLFIGNHSGCIGESSILLIAAGAVFLLITKTIDWRAPAAMIASCVVLSAILGMDPLFAVLSGGLCFGAVFMATDYVSTPVTSTGKLLFGCGAGIITVLIRKWGGYPEGVSYGILIMNAVTPFLNKFIQKKYGYVPAKKTAQGAAK